MLQDKRRWSLSNKIKGLQGNNNSNITRRGTSKGETLSSKVVVELREINYKMGMLIDLSL